MIKKDCFAYIDENKCNALIEKNCEKCSFYKKRSEIKDNPYYAYSYKDKKKHKMAIDKNNIKESQVIWK